MFGDSLGGKTSCVREIENIANVRIDQIFLRNAPCVSEGTFNPPSQSASLRVEFRKNGRRKAKRNRTVDDPNGPVEDYSTFRS